MISTINDKFDHVIAFIEWNIVNEKGQMAENGEFIYVAELWIHKHYRRRFGMVDTIDELAQKILSHPLSLGAKYVYWEREKYGNRISHSYTINHFLNKGDKHVKEKEFSTTA